MDDNRAALIQNTTEVMAIVEELGEMVHRETHADIEAKKTSQEQMRELFLKTFHPGGVAVKAAFYSVLEKHHPELLEKRSTICCRHLRTSRKIFYGTFTDSSVSFKRFTIVSFRCPVTYISI